jgi:hypothetical protein
MVFTAAEDLDTLLTADYVHTNVTSLTADPSIRKIGDDPPSDFDNGEILIGEERLVNTEQQGNYKREIYQLTVIVEYSVGSTSSTSLKEMVAEMERVFNANNLLITRTYEYFIKYSWLGSYIEGHMELIIEAISKFSVVNT